MRTSLLTAATLAAVLLGCASPTTEQATDVASATPAPTPGVEGTPATPAAPSPERTPASPSAPEDAPDAPAGTPVPCTDAERAAVEETVGGQLAAIAAGEWDAARGFATDGFREGVDVATFEALIVGGFPVLVANTDHEVGTCVRAGERAQALVTVTDGEGGESELAYSFERETAGWRVAGAVPHEGEPTTIV